VLRRKTSKEHLAIQLLLYGAPAESTEGLICRRKCQAGGGPLNIDALCAGLSWAMAQQKVCRLIDETFEKFCNPYGTGVAGRARGTSEDIARAQA
jgi:hypothetical protein